ncbi:MAG: MlaE family ABC transporter permease [Thermodesulfobacteriota bacterium]
MFEYLGSILVDFLRNIYRMVRVMSIAFTSLIFSFSVGRRPKLNILYKQVYFTGIEAFAIIFWLALIFGIIIVTQAISILPKLGGERFIGQIMVWVVIRELGPLFAAIIVIARSGTAIASELGSMKVNNEIAALEVMGINPDDYLLMPRVIGVTISIFVLTFYFEAVTILGGYLLAGFGERMAFDEYTSSIFNAMGFLDVGVSMLKSLLFGLIIGSICTYHGLRVGRSITEIPQETTKAVIGSFFMVFVVDAVVTGIFFA